MFLTRTKWVFFYFVGGKMVNLENERLIPPPPWESISHSLFPNSGGLYDFNSDSYLHFAK